MVKKLSAEAARLAANGFSEYELKWLMGDAMYEATISSETDKPHGESVNPPNPKQRYGDLKSAVQLVPPALIIHAAAATKEGAQKYGPYNWRVTKVEAMTYIGAMLRHLYAWLDGEETDPESITGKHHLDGVAASLGILLDALDGGFLIDNRPNKGPAPKLLRMPAATPTK